eukprot:TRINITY_DN11483_c0_g2_i2.p1 TRINITY_DN11483_c0_g2~~TRINITY_DN11483_c0_g2_i2.p1  ORF type:complete len:399 (-),score=7.29 TRINITY_DN11483_c0_g2_i2:257-1312(-)
MDEHVFEGPDPEETVGGAEGVEGRGSVEREAKAGGVGAAAWESLRGSGVTAAGAAHVAGAGSGEAHAEDGRAADGTATDDGDVLVPMRGYRRAMAAAMSASLSVPHFTFMDEVAMDATLALRAQLNATSAAATPDSNGTDAPQKPPTNGTSSSSSSPSSSSSSSSLRPPPLRLTHLPILVKALSVALLDFPTVNSTLDGADATHIRCRGAHNIGIAMATPSGLVVPNVKHCERKSIPQIAEEITRLRRLALRNQLPREDLSGGTISVSNVGAIGGTYATPLVNLPEVAIVALGRVHSVPRFDASGAVVPVAVMNVSWSADHRVLDGATLAAFSSRWKEYIECPAKLLLHLQ